MGANGIGGERISRLPRCGGPGNNNPCDYVVAIGYDDVSITRLIGSPVIGLDNAHHAVRGRVSFQRDAAIALSHGIGEAQPIQRVEAASIPPQPTRAPPRPEEYPRGSGVHRVAAPALYLPKCSVPIPPVKAWIHVYVPNTPGPMPIHIAQATELLNNAAMRQAAAMTEEDNVGAGSQTEEAEDPDCEPQSVQTLSPQDHVDVVEEPTQNVPEATEETGVGESQSGRTISTPGVVVVEEPTQHALVEFKRAAAIASTHGTLDGVVVDEVLMQDVPEEPEEPGVDEEITLAARA